MLLDMMWIVSGVFTLGAIFFGYFISNKSLLGWLTMIVLILFIHGTITLLILYTPLEGLMIENLQFIYGKN